MALLYVETSALLRALLGEPHGAEIRAAIDAAAKASSLHCSRLTIGEALRSLQRFKVSEHLSESAVRWVRFGDFATRPSCTT